MLQTLMHFKIIIIPFIGHILIIITIIQLLISLIIIYIIILILTKRII